MGILRTHGFLLLVAAAVLALVSEPSRGVAAMGSTTPPSDRHWADVRSMQLVTPTQGWALSTQRLAWTEDGGEHWTDITPQGVSVSAIKGVFFLDAWQGWTVVLGQPDASNVSPLLALRTSDSGQTWQTVQLDAPSTSHTGSTGAPAYLSFVDAQHGWAMVKRVTNSAFSWGDLFQTTDGGATWTKREIPVGDRIRFTSPSDGWTAGGPVGCPNSLYVTRDGGISWQEQTVKPPPTFDVNYATYAPPIFTSAEDGVLPVTFAGDATALQFYVTRDGGQSWTFASHVEHPPTIGTGVTIAADIVDTEMWILATTDGRVFRTQDGGQSWQEAAPESPLPGTALGLDFATSDIGWAVVWSGGCAGFKRDCTQRTDLFGTTDGGRTWTRLNP
jgi:photosystem II stability/assembly factor-like uncharacterized protein